MLTFQEWIQPKIDAMRWQRAVTWSKDRPIAAGWYWVKAESLSPRIIHLHRAHGQSWLTGDYEYAHTTGALGERVRATVRYAGPIPVPFIDETDVQR